MVRSLARTTSVLPAAATLGRSPCRRRWCRAPCRWCSRRGRRRSRPRWRRGLPSARSRCWPWWFLSSIVGGSVGGSGGSGGGWLRRGWSAGLAVSGREGPLGGPRRGHCGRCSAARASAWRRSGRGVAHQFADPGAGAAALQVQAADVDPVLGEQGQHGGGPRRVRRHIAVVAAHEQFAEARPGRRRRSAVRRRRGRRR